MVGLGVSSPAEAATSDPLRVTGNLGGRAFAGQLFDLSLSRPAGATSATLTGTLKGAGLPAAGMRFTATADVKASAVDPVVPATVMPTPVIPTVVVPPVAQIPGICTVLQLDVQNLHLDLLGLVVLIPDPGLHLIVGGAPRDGALLGNLLCNLAGGLDQRPSPATVTLNPNIAAQLPGAVPTAPAPTATPPVTAQPVVPVPLQSVVPAA